MSIPRLELCGAQVLTKLLCRVKKTLDIPISFIFAWTDSTIVLGWLTGSPKRFKTYVGNRVSFIIDHIPPDRWRHVPGTENPADCASRGLFPTQLREHDLWWEGPHWLQQNLLMWPNLSPETIPEEEKEMCHLTTTTIIEFKQPVIPIDRFSSYAHLRRITAWIYQFVNNACVSASRRSTPNKCHHLSVAELVVAENYWISVAQQELFPDELKSLRSDLPLSKDSILLPFRPFLDESRLLRVGGRMSNSKLDYPKMHPILLHGKHPVTKLIVEAEHLRLIHAGPTLLISSLNQRFHIIGICKTVRSITRKCIVCKRQSLKPQTQLLGQLLSAGVTPASVFERVGVDYAGPFQIKYGHVRKPTIVKAYMCLFVCLAVKAVHLELVSDLTTEAFVAALRRFTARRGCPSLIWSDHGTNFVGAKRELKEFHDFLSTQAAQGAVSKFCNNRNIEWRDIPEKSPHFGGLWESAVECKDSLETCSIHCEVNVQRIHYYSHANRSMSQ